MSKLVFGVDVMPAPSTMPRGQWKENHNITIYGPGPEGARCKTCAHLRVNRCSSNFYKCAKRHMSASATTDHRVNWSACALYEARS